MFDQHPKKQIPRHLKVSLVYSVEYNKVCKHLYITEKQANAQKMHVPSTDRETPLDNSCLRPFKTKYYSFWDQKEMGGLKGL